MNCFSHFEAMTKLMQGNYYQVYVVTEATEITPLIAEAKFNEFNAEYFTLHDAVQKGALGFFPFLDSSCQVLDHLLALISGTNETNF